TPELTAELLKTITSYISFRYAGELGLALEDLIWIGDAVDRKDWSSRLLFWNQLEWVSKQMKMNECDFESRRIKH
ncbi:MAG: hypothetical protein Q8M83_05155, partial [bacterium]|nr:hypothetical protein [bacterium]